MSEPFIAEVRIFAGNFAPRGWAFCDGQLLPILQNTALFALIGTTYGGDGRTTTALPDLKGRAPMHPGRGPGLTSRKLGERGGDETTTLTEAQMPSHTHTMVGSAADADDRNPGGKYVGGGNGMFAAPGSLGDMDQAMLPSTGGGQLHSNMQPYLSLNFIIALVGIFPSRS